MISEHDTVKQTLIEKNLLLNQILGRIKVTENQIVKDGKNWGDRTNELVYRIKNAEKEKAKKKMVFNLKRSSTTELTVQLNEELRIQEIALRSARNTLETSQNKLKEIKGMLNRGKKNRASPCRERNSPSKDRVSVRKEHLQARDRFSPYKEKDLPLKRNESPRRQRDSPGKKRIKENTENRELIILL